MAKCNQVGEACVCGKHCEHGVYRPHCHMCARKTYPDRAVRGSVNAVLKARS